MTDVARFFNSTAILQCNTNGGDVVILDSNECMIYAMCFGVREKQPQKRFPIPLSSLTGADGIADMTAFLTELIRQKMPQLGDTDRIPINIKLIGALRHTPAVLNLCFTCVGFRTDKPGFILFIRYAML